MWQKHLLCLKASFAGILWNKSAILMLNKQSSLPQSLDLSAMLLICQCSLPDELMHVGHRKLGDTKEMQCLLHGSNRGAFKEKALQSPHHSIHDMHSKSIVCKACIDNMTT